MSAMDDLWCRVLARRLAACVERFETRIAEVEDRMSDAAWDRGAWVWSGASAEAIQRGLDEFFRFKEVEAPAQLASLRRYLEEARSDLASFEAGRLTDWVAERLPDRGQHCRWGSCGRKRRRHIPIAELRAARLTQPPNVCQSCGFVGEAGENLDLDHLAELVFGGADAAFNLIRVCGACHRAKPIWPDEPPAIQRLLALDFYGIAA